MEEQVLVRRVKCRCGKSRLLAVVDPDNGLDKSSAKDIAKLVKLGLDVDTITLEEARNAELCFECKI
jgi:hypothetical protein